MADIDRAEAELVITLRVRAIDEGSAKQNISAVTAEIKKLQRELNKPVQGQSFEKVFISLFYLRQAIRTVTQSLQTFGAGNKMLQTQLNFMSQGIMNAILGWKVMDKMLRDYINSLYKSIKLEKLRVLQTKLARGEITQTMMEQEMSMLMQKQAAAAAVSGWVAIGFAVASVIPYLINLRKKTQEAAIQMLDDLANVRSTLDKFFDAKTPIESLGALAQLSKKLGTEGANNLLAFISAGGNIDDYLSDWENLSEVQKRALWTLLSAFPAFQEELKKVRKEAEAAKDPVAAAFAEYEAGLTATTVTAEQQAEVISRIVDRIEKIRIEAGLTKDIIEQMKEDYDRYLAELGSGEHINRVLDTIKKRGEAYEKYLASIGAISPIDLLETNLKKAKKSVRDFSSVISDFYIQLAELEGDYEKAFELRLQREVERWREAKISEADIAKRIALERRKFEEEQLQKLVEATFKKEEEEWKLVEEARKREEEKLKIRQELDEKLWDLYATEEAKFIETLREEVERYREAGAEIEHITQYVYKRIEDYVEQQKEKEIQAIEEEKEAQLQALEDIKKARENLYAELATMGMDEVSKRIFDILEREQYWKEETGDPEAAIRWRRKMLDDLYNQEKEKRQKLQDEILQQEQQLEDRIRELKENELQYRFEQLDRQAQQYIEFGLSQRKTEEWLYEEKMRLWEQEVQNFLEKERRKQEAQETAYYRYQQFILKAQGLEAESRLQSELQSVKDLIRDIWKAYGETDPEKAKEMVYNIIGFLPDYLHQTFDQTQQELENWTQEMIEWSTGTGKYSQYEKIYYKPEWGKWSPWSYAEEVEPPQKTALENIFVTPIKKAQEELKKFFEELINPPQPEIPDWLAKLKPIKPDLDQLDDSIKDVTLSTKEWAEKVREVMTAYYSLQADLEEWYNDQRKEIETHAEEAKKEVEKKIKMLIQNLYAQATQNILGAPSWYETGYTSGRAYTKGFIEGVEDLAPDIAEVIAQYVAFHSPPEKGPLSDSDKYGYRFIKMFIESMMRGIPYLAQSIRYVFAPVSPEHIFYNFYDRLTKPTQPFYLRKWGEFFKEGKTIEPFLKNVPTEEIMKYYQMFISPAGRREFSRLWWEQVRKPIAERDKTLLGIMQFVRFLHSFDVSKQGMTDAERHLIGRFTTEELLSKYVGAHGQGWTKAIQYLLKAKEVGKITEEEFKKWTGKVFEMLLGRGGQLTETEQQWVDWMKQHPDTWGQSYINQYLTYTKANFSPAMLAWMLSYYGEEGIKQNFPDLWEKLRTGQYGYNIFGQDISAYWMAQIPWGQAYGQQSGTSTTQYGTGLTTYEPISPMGGAGIMINLIFNIDEVNDINIKDFAKMVSDEVMNELSKYIV